MTTDTARWDPLVAELVQIVGDLARLSAAATGQREAVAQLQEGAAHVATAASLLLPLSSLGRAEEL